MDSKNNFLERITEFVASIDEEYLIGISNKGILNRGKKDLEAIKNIEVEIQTDSIKLTLPHETVCFISEKATEYKCSCPSRTVCKHIIISFLYLKNNFNTLFPSEVENRSTSCERKDIDFEKLLTIKLDNLMDIVGSKLINEVIKRIKFGLEAEIEESSMLTIRFKEEGYVVKFLTRNWDEVSDAEILEEALCSCKSKEICRHKIEGLLNYQLYKKVLQKEDLKTFDKKSNIEKEKYIEVVSLVKKAMEEILYVGLSRLPETTLENMETMALLCHNSNIPNLEKLLRNIRTEIEFYINKSASFTVSSFKNKISNIYTAAVAIENCCKENKADDTRKYIYENRLIELCGEHKSTYYDIPPIKLWGIGAEAWSSKSGYEGITYYFFLESRDMLLTYTNSRPTYYDNNKRKNFQIALSTVPNWGIEGKLEEISKSGMKLINGKINEENRISSSAQSSGEILERTSIYELKLDKYTIDNWEELLQRFCGELVKDIPILEKIFVIRPLNYGKSSFDNIKQRFTLPIYDIRGKLMNIVLDFSPEKKMLIRKFERMERSNKYPDSILGRIYIIDGNFSVEPITAYYTDGTISNLTLE
jgi:hypothetical protein